MRADAIRDQMRKGIVEESVQVLRRHGRSEEEIRSTMERNFHIREEALNEILNSDEK